MSVAVLVAVLLSGCCHVKSLELIGVKNEILRLDNELCAPRPSLVEVGGVNDLYYPLVISLHRCGGACAGGTSTRACVNTSSMQLHVHVLNRITNTNETMAFTNHTACGCSCVHDASVCMRTQVWNENTCSCTCKQEPVNTTSQCGENFQWNPRFCICECDRTCTHNKKYLNETSCTCECIDKVYQKCSRRGKIVRESDCKCDTKYVINPLLCGALPPKWAAIIIVISFFAFVVLAVDCLLYCKSTGCMYKATHLCLKEHRNSALRKREKCDSEEIVDIVQLKTAEAT